MKLFINKKRGFVLLNSIVFGTIATILIIGLTSWFGVTIKGSRGLANREQAFHIAEAGIDYYRWHLAHNRDDYQDGTEGDGPYIHDFFDKDGNKIGEFSLNITKPITGSTVVTIESTGTIETDQDVSRTIRTQLAIPSFAKYVFVADEAVRFGEDTEVFGQVHSNDGIRFDGLAHNLVTSAKEDYDDPDHSGQKEWAVHTHVSPTDALPPTAMADRFDIFEIGREVGVPAIDFDGLTSDMADLKTDAQENGHYYASSGKQGYRILFKADNTYDLYKVESQASKHSSCNNALGQSKWDTWSVDAESFIGNYEIPENGIIFLEDHTWVEGEIDGSRVTVAVARFPEAPGQYRNIIINNDLEYNNFDGTDVIGLIAQGDIHIGMISDDNLIINAAMIAQNGRVGRYYYRGPWSRKPGCSPYHVRSEVDIYGMIATRQRYGFAYTDNTGYQTRNITYDTNLLFAPPPNFPLTSDQYEIISWEEVEN
ncbi:hypothetical protein H6775_01140 [Candidatus Nomurabacteria bacterium]|nr:hypothetical protein [Candidatus Nomurabacteria bacterium]